MTRLDMEIWICDVQRSIRCDLGSIIEPLASIAGPALDLSGFPEVGIPLQAAVGGAELGQGNLQGGLGTLAGAGLAGAGIPGDPTAPLSEAISGSDFAPTLGGAPFTGSAADFAGIGGELPTAASTLPPDVLSQVAPFISPQATEVGFTPNQDIIYQDPGTTTQGFGAAQGTSEPTFMPGSKTAIVSTDAEGQQLVSSGQAQNFILDTGATGAGGIGSQTAVDAAATAGAATPTALPTTPALGATTSGFETPIAGAGGGAAAGAAPLTSAVGETGGALSAGPAALAPSDVGAGSTGLADTAVSDIFGAPPGGIEPLTGQIAGGESAIPFTGGSDTTGSILGGAGSSILNFIKRNPAVALGAGGIGLSALTSPSIPNLGKMKNIAGQVQTTAGQEIGTLESGKLPPGAEQMVQNAVQDAQAGIRSRYASQGLSGSTMEQQDLNAVEERAAATRFQIAEQITQQGLNAAGLSEQIYAQIAGLVLNQDQGLQNAIAGFSTAAGFGAGLEALRS